MWRSLPELAEARKVSIGEVIRETIRLNVAIYQIGNHGRPKKRPIPDSWKADLMTDGLAWCAGERLGASHFLVMDDAEILQHAAPASQSQPSAYSTPWLELQGAAVAKFFEPRRDIDAKQPEVVDWIKAEALRRGLPDSDNLAAAIFTIIKPVDHNPKKRKG